MSYAKYGLTEIKASSSDHDKGIVKGPDGQYYQIDGFKHGQKKDTDADQGDVFKSSLYEDSGADFSNFNTATDVEGALKLLEPEAEEKNYGGDQDNIELSPRLATARARALQYEEDRVSGQAMKDLYDSENNPAEGFLDRYKSKLGKQLDNGYYSQPDSSATNSSKVASGANDVSIDVSKFARTGIDNRKDV